MANKSLSCSLSVLLIGFQAIENSEEMKLKMKKENSEEPKALVPDKVGLLISIFIVHLYLKSHA